MDLPRPESSEPHAWDASSRHGPCQAVGVAPPPGLGAARGALRPLRLRNGARAPQNGRVGVVLGGWVSGDEGQRNRTFVLVDEVQDPT